MNLAKDYKDLKLKLTVTKPGQALFRNILFDKLFSSLPRDPEVKVQIYNAEIVPGGYTNWHCHNGATFFCGAARRFRGPFSGGSSNQGKSRRGLFGTDRKISSRSQSPPGAALLVHRILLDLAGPRAHHKRGPTLVAPSCFG